MDGTWVITSSVHLRARAVGAATQAVGEPVDSQSRATPSPGSSRQNSWSTWCSCLQDVRYLHFLEGTRDYEWLEAMFLNQTMAKTKLSWFRYPLPSSSCSQSPGQTEQ